MKALLILLALLDGAHTFSQTILEVPMKSFRSKPIIQVELNGKKSYFLVDSGSDISVVNTTALKHYGLFEVPVYQDGAMAIGFSGNTTQMSRIRNAELNFGDGLIHRDFMGYEMDPLVNSIEAKTGLRIAGIIGADVLVRFHCVIDYSRRSITFVSKRSAKALAAAD
jgi:hypothetical protein